MDRRCRVLRVITRMNVGGPARHVNMLLRGLDSDVYSQRLLAGRCADGEAECDVDASVDRRDIAHLGRGVALLGDLVARSELAAEVADYGPRIVHSHTAKAGLLARMVVQGKRRVRTVHTFHGFNFTGHLWPGAGRLSRWTERFLGARTDAFVVQSESQRKVLESVLHRRDHGRCHVIRPAVQQEFLTLAPVSRAATRRALDLAEDDRVLLFAGRLAAVKRPLLLLEILHALRGDAHLRLVVAGDGPLRERFMRAVRALDLAPRVRLLASRVDPWSLMDAADALLLVSRSEGTPLVLLEAQARGLPVVATDVGGVRELLGDGQVLVEPGATAEALSRAVTQLLRERSPGDQLAVAARGRVASQFAESALIANIEGLYRALDG